MDNLTITLSGPNWICCWNLPNGESDGTTEAIGTVAADVPTRLLYAVAEALIHYRTALGREPRTVVIRLYDRAEIDAAQPFADAYRRGKMPAGWGTYERALCVHLPSFNLSYALLDEFQRATMTRCGEGAAIETAISRLSGGLSGLALLAG